MHQLLAVFGVFCFLAFSGVLDSHEGRVHNFSAGPASLRLAVLRKARSLFLSDGSGKNRVCKAKKLQKL